jgi:hypothetical protein
MKHGLKLDRRHAPDSSRPFVNRRPEIELVQAKLDAGIDGGPIRSGIVCFWGAFGLGKSWLLLTLERQNRGRHTPRAGTHPTIAARLDLDHSVGRVFWLDGRLDRALLIRELWQQLAEQMATKLPDLDRDSPDAQATEFVNQVTRWAATSATPIIMLDTIDHVLTRDRKAFVWFERHIIERLAVTERVLFCFTSRGELRRWDRFQIRRRVTLHRLKAFNLEATAEQIGAGPVISTALYRQAFGHPLTTDFLGTALERAGVDLQNVQGDIDVLDQHLLQDVLGYIVGESVSPLSDLEQALARRACVLRWLHVEPLRFLAERLQITEVGRGDQYYVDRLNALQAEHLLYWNSTTSVYEFDPVLRKLLSRYLELERQGEYCATHDAAYRFHKGHLERYPVYLKQYVPELAYHRTLLGRCHPATSHPSLPEWWREFLSKGPPPTQEPWQELVQSLAKDKELANILPKDEYDLLYKTAREHAAHNADKV